MWHQHRSFSVSENSEVTSIPGEGLPQSHFEAAHHCSKSEWHINEIRQREKASSLFPMAPHFGSVFSKLFSIVFSVSFPTLCYYPDCRLLLFSLCVSNSGAYRGPILRAKSSKPDFLLRCLSELYPFITLCFFSPRISGGHLHIS